ncbi:MAG: ABC transporter substrate-binding protein [Lachnospiraceae bacterium]|nr:ABC transporter substrate-binding protein [Lachnospiraceae bacterium]
MKKKLVAAILAAGMVIASLSGCGSSASVGSESSASGETSASQETSDAAQTGGQETAQITGSGKAPEGTGITVGLSSNVSSLAPFDRGTLYTKAFQYEIFETLGTVTSDGELEYGIMKSYEIVDDYTYNIEIYDYVYDSAGVHFTASDAKFCFEQFAGLGTAYALIDSIEVVDDYNFTIHLTSTTLTEFYDLISDVFMLTEESYNNSGDGMATSPVGTGPYVVKEFVGSSYLVLEKNDNFWQTDEDLIPKKYKANIDYIRFDFITESTQMDIALDLGTVQAAWDLDSSLVDSYKENDGFTVYEADGGIVRYLAFNGTENSVFADNEALRKAIIYAIDRESLMSICIGEGKGYVPNAFASKMSIDYNTDWDTQEYYTYDLEKAKEYMEEAGYADGGLELTILATSTTMNNTMCEVLQSQLSEIGISLKIVTEDTSTFNVDWDATVGTYDLLLTSAASKAYVPVTWASFLDGRTRSSGLTIFGVEDATLQSMLEEATDPSTYSVELVNEIQDYLVDTAYMTTLFDNYRYTISVAEVENVWINTYGMAYPVFGASTYSSSYSYTVD